MSDPVAMRRINQTELETVIYQALKAAPANAKTGLRSKLAMERPAHKAMDKRITARLPGDLPDVVVPNPVDNGFFDKRPGVWVRDEPEPSTQPLAPSA